MENIIVGVVIAVIVGYSLYEHFKPASGKRARNEKGRYVKDDKSTPHKNEAYEDGKTPKRKRKAPAKKKPAAKKAPAKKAPAKKAPAKRGRPRKAKK